MKFSLIYTILVLYFNIIYVINARKDTNSISQTISSNSNYQISSLISKCKSFLNQRIINTTSNRRYCNRIDSNSPASISSSPTSNKRYSIRKCSNSYSTSNSPGPTTKSTSCISNSITNNSPASKNHKLILQLRGGGILSNLPSAFQFSGFKVLLQLSISILNGICWILPLYNKNFQENEVILSFANIFAGGIFLMLSLGHMIPHSISLLASQNWDMKNAFYFGLVGFCMILFIEKIAFDTTILSNNEKDENTKPCLHSAIILVLALSLHSLFEALALGLSSDISSSSLLAASIALHQPAESIALLVAFMKSNISKQNTIKWMSFYTLMGPLGVILGIIISRVSNPIIEGIAIALTAGTFLYVGSSEVCLFLISK